MKRIKKIQILTDYQDFKDCEKSGMAQEMLDQLMTLLISKAKKFGEQNYLQKLIEKDIDNNRKEIRKIFVDKINKDYKVAHIVTSEQSLAQMGRWLRVTREKVVNNRQLKCYLAVQKKYTDSKLIQLENLSI